MLINLRSLIVVLVISMTVFALAKPMCLRYIEAEALKRRRNIWLALTVVSFLSPSIWLYATFAIPLMYWGAKRDDHPLGLYILLTFVVPPASVQIPTIGIGQLFELNQHRMMSLTILLPLIFRGERDRGMTSASALTGMDYGLLALGALQMILVAPYELPTNTLRRGMLFFLDTYIVFYAFARVRPTAKALREVIASFVLVAAILCGVGLFESWKGWLLYLGIAPAWGAPEGYSAYLIRGNVLRAQASTGHSLSLGYHAALGLGFWMYLSGAETRRLAKYGMFALLCGGLFVSGSRGAWVTAMILFCAYVALRPDLTRYLSKALPVLVVAIVVAFNSPLKESVINKLPIIGNAEQDTVDYRQQVAEVSWRLIKQNPILGDPFALRNMEELRQGQGIIDLVNAYANIALFSGGLGVAFFVSTFAIAVWRGFIASRQWRPTDPDMSMLGASLVASLVASLFFIGTAGVEHATYWLTGLLATYASASLVQARSAMSMQPALRAR